MKYFAKNFIPVFFIFFNLSFSLASASPLADLQTQSGSVVKSTSCILRSTLFRPDSNWKQDYFQTYVLICDGVKLVNSNTQLVGKNLLLEAVKREVSEDSMVTRTLLINQLDKVGMKLRNCDKEYCFFVRN